jgi:Ribonuclease G/E
MTSLGLVQLTRKKTSLPIEEFMLDRCDDCMDGHVVSGVQALLMMRADLVDFALKNPDVVLSVRVNPALIEAYKDVDVFSMDKEKSLKRRKVVLVPDEGLKRNNYFFDKCDCEDNLPQNAVEI